MDTITIYHNPRCGKSRAALSLLQERGLPLRIVEYLKEPLTRSALVKLGKQLGLPPQQWLRKGEAEYKIAGLSNDSSTDEIFDAIAKYPILMERPIVVNGDRAVVGRPPERSLDLLA